jgi:hypothetical protein
VSDHHEALVLDALYNRQGASAHDCLTHNSAGVRLAGLGLDAIPAIEKVLRERVIPSPSYDPFDGLKYVLGAYALISSRAGYAGFRAFTSSLPPALQLEALYALFAFFRKMPDGYNFGVPPGAQVEDYLRLTSKSPENRRNS